MNLKRTTLFTVGFAVLAAPAAQAAIISGTITDQSSTPIANAEVRLKVSEDVNGGPDYAAITTTDGAGNYSFNVDIDASRSLDDVDYYGTPILINDNVVIEVGAPGFSPQRIGAGEMGCHYFCRYEQAGSVSGIIQLTPGSNEPNVDAQLAEGGVFEGTITAANGGAALPDVPVQVFVDPGDGQGLRTFNAATSVSDASGDWQTRVGLPAGNYPVLAGNQPGSIQVNDTGFGNYVTMAWGGYECEWGSCAIGATSTLAANAGVLASNIDFALPDGAELTGTLYDPAGTQLGSGDDLVMLRLYTPDLGIQIATIGTFDGTYRLEGLSGGNYIAEYVPSGQDIETFVRILSDGSYCPWGGCNRTEAIPMAIPAGATRVRDVFFQEGWLFDVAVTDIAGTPISHTSELQVDVIRSASGAIAGGGSNYGTPGSPIDSVTTRHGVPAGDYIIALGGRFFGRGGVNDSNYVDAAAPGVNCLGAQCRDNAAITTYSLSGTPGTINVTINADTGHTISGTVDDGASAGLGGRAVTFMNGAGQVLYHSFTEADGSYTSPALPNGDYRVAVRDGGETSLGYFQTDGLGYLGAVHGGGDCMGALECLGNVGTTVSIAGSDVSNLDFSLSTGPTISGQVIDTMSGLPVFLEVEITDDMGDLVDTYSTYRDGEFITGGLRPGTYTITPVTTRAYSLSSSGGTVSKQAKASAGSQTVVVGSSNVVLTDPLTVAETLVFEDDFGR